MVIEFLIPTNKNKKKRKKFWFEQNQDAAGYLPNDNRVFEDRREVVRRTFNF
jgi:hypothetical protein